MIAVPIARDRRDGLPARAIRHMRPRLVTGIIERGFAEFNCTQAQGLRDLLYDQFLEGPTGHSLEHDGEHVIAAVRVAKAGPGHEQQRGLQVGGYGALSPLRQGQAGDVDFRTAGPWIRVGMYHAAVMRHEMTYRDVGDVRRHQPHVFRIELTERRIPGQPAALDQYGCDRAGEILGQRPELPMRAHGDRSGLPHAPETGNATGDDTIGGDRDGPDRGHAAPPAELLERRTEVEWRIGRRQSVERRPQCRSERRADGGRNETAAIDHSDDPDAKSITRTPRPGLTCRFARVPRRP